MLPARTSAFVALLAYLMSGPGIAAEVKTDSAVRPAKNEADLRYWLENMVVYHQFSDAEISAATGLSETDAKAARERFGFEPSGPPKRVQADPLFVVPYPGGRHPRIGFLDGAVRPVRESKLSIFAPWDDGGYAVADVPEAIWSDRGLLWLAHEHVPTLWTKQGVELHPLEWTRNEDGSFEVERTLPDGVTFGTRVIPQHDSVQMEMWLVNGSNHPLSDLRVQNCVMLKGLKGFEEQTNDNKLFPAPYAVARDTTGQRWVIVAWEPNHRSWGNAPCPCLHSDPKFPDCPPGETRRLRGRLSFYEGTDIADELKRIDAIDWQTTSVETTSRQSGVEVDPEIVIYGGTPAGIAAAIEAGRTGRKVLLVEPYSWVGGLITNGLSHPDFRTFEGLNGFYLDLTRRTLAYYTEKYGADSAQVKDCLHGTHSEPHVNRLILERMLAETPSVTVRTRCRLVSVKTTPKNGQSHILSATFKDASGNDIDVRASIWIDASYEGDLAAAAGAKYRVGREGRDEYGESLAPEQGDDQVQGYNFRFAATSNPDNRVAPVAPEGYSREDYVGILPLLEAGKLEGIFGYTPPHVYKDQIPHLPNDKRDINDVSRSLVRLSLPDVADGWPDGDEATRREIFAKHVRHNIGLLYFLQNDDAVPTKYRDEARRWGWCRDEFVENNHVPEQLYIREARRIMGEYVFTEKDVTRIDGDVRTPLRSDAIAICDYGPNCHGTSHEGPLFGGKHTGEFYKGVPPYQVPYGVILPSGFDNLVVPVAVSASHVGFCALRLEPVWSSLGQAAGTAARLALEEGASVQDVAVEEIQHHLHSRGAATTYLSDISPASPDFAAVQWWGTQGGFHGLTKPADESIVRGPNIIGQYYEAFPGHAAELDAPITPEVRKHWQKLAASLGLPLERLSKASTRGELIREAFAARGQRTSVIGE